MKLHLTGFELFALLICLQVGGLCGAAAAAAGLVVMVIVCFLLSCNVVMQQLVYLWGSQPRHCHRGNHCSRHTPSC